jgi:tetratricopeptide (TPR) repeat protein
VAERKDVLSTFFWMLTVWAYVSYVERRGRKRYFLTLFFFALGLMTKPMLVTLPFVLLLLDYWPLHRLPIGKSPVDEHSQSEKYLNTHNKKEGLERSTKEAWHINTTEMQIQQWRAIGHIILEKIPFFILSLVSSISTYVAQQKSGAMAMGSLQRYSLPARIANAFVSYCSYIGKTVWPDSLAVLYPHAGMPPAWKVMWAVFFLAIATFLIIKTMRRYPYLTTGWLWYLGTLVPVIGLVQVGSQAMADRYTYIPMVGLFIMVAWGIPELLKKWRYRKEVLFASSVLTISCLFIVTWIQVGYWQNSITLFDHTLKVTTGNSIAYNNRGGTYQTLGKHGQAIKDFDRAIEISPNYADAYNNRGNSYQNLGNYNQAIEDYDKAIELNQKLAQAYNNRGVSYQSLGNYDQAIKDFGKAIELNPNYADAYTNLGNAYVGLGNYGQAIKDYDSAIKINPNHAKAYSNRGNAYNALGDYNQAIKDCDKVIELNPNYTEAYYNRGNAYGGLGNFGQAIKDYDKAIELNPKFVDAYNNRGIAYAKIGNCTQAIEYFNKAIELNPKYANAYNNRGISYGLLGDYNQAIKDYDKAIELNPNSADAYNNRGNTYNALGNQKQAIEDLKTAARLGYENAKNILRSHGINW